LQQQKYACTTQSKVTFSLDQGYMPRWLCAAHNWAAIECCTQGSKHLYVMQHWQAAPLPIEGGAAALKLL